MIDLLPELTTARVEPSPDRPTRCPGGADTPRGRTSGGTPDVEAQSKPDPPKRHSTRYRGISYRERRDGTRGEREVI